MSRVDLNHDIGTARKDRGPRMFLEHDEGVVDRHWGEHSHAIPSVSAALQLAKHLVNH